MAVPHVSGFGVLRNRQSRHRHEPRRHLAVVPRSGNHRRQNHRAIHLHFVLMIRVVMLGRLGNNLFQYALGRALSEKHGVPLQLDASWFNGRTWPYVSPLGKLPGFAAQKTKLTRPFSFGSRALKKLTEKHHWEYLDTPIIREPENDQSFNPAFLQAPSDCVVFGYFQSPLYFHEIEHLIRSELSTEELGLEVGHEDLAEQLRKQNSVAVHVRRQDYVNNSNLHLPSIRYYKRAMNQLREVVPSARFFVFSDDPKWCIEEFVSPDTTVLTHSDLYQPLTDLHLMSLASNHIIANSSYSWWAAWLGKKEGQTVTMPNQWFKESIKAPIMEKMCAGWTTLES